MKNSISHKIDFASAGLAEYKDIFEPAQDTSILVNNVGIGIKRTSIL